MTYEYKDTNFMYFDMTTREAFYVDAVFVQSKRLWKVPINLDSVSEMFEETGAPELFVLKKEIEGYDNWVDGIVGNPVPSLEPRLRPYQAEDAYFLKERTTAGVFNEQRTGKTPTILAATKHMDKGIIVCPAGLKLNWLKEILTWSPKRTIVIGGTKKARVYDYEAFNSMEQAYLIVSYETLRADILNLNLKYDFLIVDEAHRLRNYKTAQSKAVYKLAKDAWKVYALTGTPAVNHASDVFGILKLLQPTKYRSYWQFVDRYFKVSEGFYGKELLGLKDKRKREFTRLLKHVSTQRKRKDIMSWIPKVTERVIPLELRGLQKSHYNRALKEFMYGSKEIPTVLAQLTRLRQICNDPALLELGGISEKTKFITEYRADNPEANIIIFSSFTSYLKILHKLVDGALLLTGEQTIEEKQAAVDAIQTGTGRVLLANIRAGGVGFTIDNADTVIFADRSYNPVDNDQAADRFIPTDPDKEYGAKQIIDLVMQGTIENRILTLLKDKYNIISYVNNYIDNIGVKLGVE